LPLGTNFLKEIVIKWLPEEKPSCLRKKRGLAIFDPVAPRRMGPWYLNHVLLGNLSLKHGS
jgi:hypothetical protein